VSGAGVARTIAAAGESAGERARKNSARDIPADFAARPAPCLFVYGGADPEAEAAWGVYERFTARNGISATRVVVPGANHNYYRVDWSARAEAAALDFLTADLPEPGRAPE
jgi:hypothetical protein